MFWSWKHIYSTHYLDLLRNFQYIPAECFNICSRHSYSLNLCGNKVYQKRYNYENVHLYTVVHPVRISISTELLHNSACFVNRILTPSNFKSEDDGHKISPVFSCFVIYFPNLLHCTMNPWSLTFLHWLHSPINTVLVSVKGHTLLAIWHVTIVNSTNYTSWCSLFHWRELLQLSV